MPAKKRPVRRKKTTRKVARKRVAKRKVTRRKVAKKKVSVNAPSRRTGKAPSARLKKRRAKNTRSGYYPNPAHKAYVVAANIGNKLGYFDGTAFVSDKHYAAHLKSPTAANNIAKAAINNKKIRAVTVVPSTTAASTIRQSLALPK